MSRPDLSPSQRDAVEHPFADACVTAGAGSGKTRVLAERFVYLVDEHELRVRDVAALTFTEKAAGEMRGRIAKYFEAAGKSAERDDVEFAPISTIHAFCARLLRLHSVEAGLDPAFHVLDAAEATLLREDALALTENVLREIDPDVFIAYRAMQGREPRDAIIELLEALRGTGTDLDALAWFSADDDADVVMRQIREAADELASFGPRVKEPDQEAFDAGLADVRDLDAVLRDEAPEYAAFKTTRVADVIKAFKFCRAKGFAAAREALAAQVDTLAGILLDRYGAAEVLPRLARLLAETDRAYARLKREQSALDFTDLELEARRLLRQFAERGRRPDIAPVAMLVDEYQDTNPVQAEILALLRKESPLREGAPQFAVGDPKQSIYSFRGADVTVIVKERERVGAAGRHELDTSYRAHPDLVSRLNALNQHLFSAYGAGVDYEPLVAGGTFGQPARPALEVAYVDVGLGGDIALARRAEAGWIADRIRAFVEDEAPRSKAGAEARLGYGDIAILLRARTDIAIYQRALEAAGIPHLAVGGSGYFDAEEIKDLIYVLRVIHDPSDEYALACVVTGPAMAATDADLLRWFGPKGRAFDRMLDEARRGGPHAYVTLKLEDLRREAIEGRLAEVVEGAIAALGLFEVALMGLGGDGRAANLRKAVDVARRLDAAGRRDLGDLLRHLAALKERNVSESDAPVGGADSDVVRIMTVHGAKGLEFPVVFLADVGRKGVPDREAFRQDGNGSLAVKIAEPLEGTTLKPGGYVELEARDKRLSDEESMRLFYVATTRAEEQLIISAGCTGSNKGNGYPKSVERWGAKLWGALQVPFEHEVHEAELAGLSIPVHVVDATEIDAAEETPAEASPIAWPEATSDDLLEAERLRSVATSATQPLGDTRFVVTVSELLAFAASPARYYQDVVLLGARREGAGGGAPTGLDRAALGRAVHAAIEHLGPSGVLDPAVFEHLVRAEFPDGGGALEATSGMLARFVASPTGRRCLAALAAGEGVQREVAFHARVRFPDGATVAGLDSLLVNGSIDLWLHDDGGMVVIDHKTNRRSRHLPTPEAVGAYYAVQLRLYVLAAERLLGKDVGAARLLLLDPSWGAEAVEVEIDVGGDELRATRRLCEAFAIAALERRYPEDWRSLLSPAPVS